MNKKYPAIGFDWSGVVYFHPTKFHKMVTEFLNISVEEFSNVYYKHNHLINTQEIGAKEFWTIIFTELGYANKVDGFIEALNNLPKGRYNDEMLSVLKLLRNKGYKLGLFSNHTMVGAKEARELGVDNFFDVTLFSAEVGVMKTNPEAYLLLAEKLGVDISELIFIDDTPNFLDKAESIGFTPILYTDMSSFLTRLQELDILSKEEIANL